MTIQNGNETFVYTTEWDALLWNAEIEIPRLGGQILTEGKHQIS